VSIKSKLITAVTTAGLLASLFGTALLPVARAAASVVSNVSLNVKSSDTDLVADLGGGVYHVKAGKSISIEGEFDVDDADGVNVSASVTGTTITSYTGTLDTPVASIASNGKSVSFGFLDNLTNNNVEFIVAGPAAGAQASITIGTQTIYIIGVAANLVGVPNSAKSSMDDACEPNDSDGMGGGGVSCYVSKVDYLDYNGGYIEYLLDIEDAYGSAVTDGFFTSASITGGVAGVVVTDDSTNCTDDESTSDQLVDDDGEVYICVASDGTPSAAFTLTVTVGTLSYTRKIAVVGEISTLALAAPSSILNTTGLQDVAYDELSSMWLDSFAVTAKDAAGNIIGNGGGIDAGYNASKCADGDCGSYGANTQDANDVSGEMDAEMDSTNSTAYAGDDFEFVVTDKDGNAVNDSIDNTSFDTDYSDSTPAGSYQDENVYAWNDWTNAFDDEGYKTTSFGEYDETVSAYLAQPDNHKFNTPEGLCGGLDAGTIRKVSVEDDLGLISSNVVTVTCVDEYAQITGAAQSVASVTQNGRLTYTFTATDGNGFAAGDGATREVSYSTSWGTTGTLSLEFQGGSAIGRITVAPENSGSHTVILTVTDNETASGNQTWTKSFAVTTTNPADAFTVNSLVKSKVVAARAVAVFSGSAGKKITFTVENARTGVVREYVRLANAAGKAWYTIPARGVYYVTATFGDRVTETIRLVK